MIINGVNKNPINKVVKLTTKKGAEVIMHFDKNGQVSKWARKLGNELVLAEVERTETSRLSYMWNTGKNAAKKTVTRDRDEIIINKTILDSSKVVYNRINSKIVIKDKKIVQQFSEKKHFLRSMLYGMFTKDEVRRMYFVHWFSKKK